VGRGPRVRQPPEPVAFALVDGVERMPVGRAPARLHLDHDEVHPAGGDDVELTRRAAPVAVEHRVAEVLQVRRSALFAVPPRIGHLAKLAEDVLSLGNASGEGWFLTAEMLELIEVQSGDYLGEDDIVRYEDVYGRS